MQVKVDLPNQTITNLATGKSEKFDINGYKKHCLMNGLDDIDYLLTVKDKTEKYEKDDVTNIYELLVGYSICCKEKKTEAEDLFAGRQRGSSRGGHFF